jgi:hypothetical protein
MTLGIAVVKSKTIRIPHEYMSGTSKLCGGVSLVTPPSAVRLSGVVGGRWKRKAPASTPLVRINAEVLARSFGRKALLSIEHGVCAGMLL